jgi:hypothetical protein
MTFIVYSEFLVENAGYYYYNALNAAEIAATARLKKEGQHQQQTTMMATMTRSARGVIDSSGDRKKKMTFKEWYAASIEDQLRQQEK